MAGDCQKNAGITTTSLKKREFVGILEGLAGRENEKSGPKTAFVQLLLGTTTLSSNSSSMMLLLRSSRLIRKVCEKFIFVINLNNP